MIAALPADVNDQLEQFELTVPLVCRDRGYYRRLAAEGMLNLNTITFFGRPAFLVGWTMTDDRGFWVHLVKELGGGAPTHVLFQCLEQFARDRGANYLRGATVRKGMIKMATSFGWNPEAVVLVKPL
jgi:hypothetical protein